MSPEGNSCASTISRLNSRLGERVLGTVQNVGTDIMTIADLTEMEARVDIIFLLAVVALYGVTHWLIWAIERIRSSP